MKVAVVGHVEWVEFGQVDGVVASGAILRTRRLRAEAAGGGGVAAAELARLTGACHLQTAVGCDAIGQAVTPALSALGVQVCAASRPEPHRRAVTLLGADGERTIVVIGPAQQPLGVEFDAMEGFDGVYFCKGDEAAAKKARHARIMVGTARVLSTFQRSSVQLDALVHSGRDPSEVYREGDLTRPPKLVATTLGEGGGRWASLDGRVGGWEAAPIPGQLKDTYGAGDCFAAGLTFALARGMPPQAAVDFAARSGAMALTRSGAHGLCG